MGLLESDAVRETLSWTDCLKYADLAHDLAAQQFLNIFRHYTDHLSHTPQSFLWGEEIEYILIIKTDNGDHSSFDIWPKGAQSLMPHLQSQSQSSLNEKNEGGDKQIAGVQWFLEYAGYMVEGVPAKPYTGLSPLGHLKAVLQKRRLELSQTAKSVEPGCEVITAVNCALLGTQSFKPSDNLYSQSQWSSDEWIGPHVRFRTLTRNIRERRGSKVDIRLPIPLCSKMTAHRQPNDATNEKDAVGDEAVKLDAMVFGMGCCCVQVTVQAPDLPHALALYDQLAVLAPMMLALSAGMPAAKGHLLATDTRWSSIRQAVDDRKESETGQLRKSRYDTASLYLSSNDPTLNDLDVSVNPKIFDKFVVSGVPEQLARHYSHMFIREPLLLYAQDIHATHAQNGIDKGAHLTNLAGQGNFGTNFFDGINGTHWYSVRLKPPSPSIHINGWRVEFRPMEIQRSDAANAALIGMVVALSQAILKEYAASCKYLVKLMPISQVDENMEIAQQSDAYLKGIFHWQGRKCNLKEIIEELLEYCSLPQDMVDLIKGRVNGSNPTDAHLLRQFYVGHKEYKGDGRITPAMHSDALRAFYLHPQQQ